MSDTDDSELYDLLDGIRAKLAAGAYSREDKDVLRERLQEIASPAAIADDAAELAKLKTYLFLGWWIDYCAEHGFFEPHERDDDAASPRADDSQ